MKRLNLLLILLITAAAAFESSVKSAPAMTNEISNRKTVADRLGEFGEAARARLAPGFERAGVTYPPTSLKWVAIKEDRVLKIYAPDSQGSNRWIHTYPIKAASGLPGPKLREGDRQVPEGIYPIEAFNPNSSYHVSLRVGYPNEFDRAIAAKEGRTNLGGDIMIHGKAVSIGCLAMGDEAAEDLFTLAADTGLQNIKVIITPVDFRAGKSVSPKADLPPWTDELYAHIKQELFAIPLEDAK